MQSEVLSGLLRGTEDNRRSGGLETDGFGDYSIRPDWQIVKGVIAACVALRSASEIGRGIRSRDFRPRNRGLTWIIDETRNTRAVLREQVIQSTCEQKNDEEAAYFFHTRLPPTSRTDDFRITKAALFWAITSCG